MVSSYNVNIKLQAVSLCIRIILDIKKIFFCQYSSPQFRRCWTLKERKLGKGNRPAP
jgi:hypothetical protein